MESMCGAAVGNYGAAVGNQAQLVGKCGPLPRAGWTETERKRPTVRGLILGAELTPKVIETQGCMALGHSNWNF